MATAGDTAPVPQHTELVNACAQQTCNDLGSSFV
jgi:hypothetical protein